MIHFTAVDATEQKTIVTPQGYNLVFAPGQSVLKDRFALQALSEAKRPISMTLADHRNHSGVVNELRNVRSAFRNAKGNDWVASLYLNNKNESLTGYDWLYELESTSKQQRNQALSRNLEAPFLLNFNYVSRVIYNDLQRLSFIMSLRNPVSLFIAQNAPRQGWHTDNGHPRGSPDFLRETKVSAVRAFGPSTNIAEQQNGKNRNGDFDVQEAFYVDECTSSFTVFPENTVHSAPCHSRFAIMISGHLLHPYHG